MGRKIDLLIKGLLNPNKAIHHIFALIDNKFKLTETARVSGGGERLLIRDWQSAKNSRDFTTLAHIQRYEEVLPHVKGLRCFDAGCGSGYGTYYLAKGGVDSIVGVDISIEAINFARKHYRAKNLTYLQLDARNLEFEDNYFDAIVSFDVLEHLDNRDQEIFISGLARVLNIGGILYIGCPNATVSIGNNPHHLKELTKIEFESLLQKYFGSVTILGQDILKNGMRQKENWYKCIHDLSYQDLVIVEDVCDFAYGLFAICKKPIRW